jgi:hypothetical protein
LGVRAGYLIPCRVAAVFFLEVEVVENLYENVGGKHWHSYKRLLTLWYADEAKRFVKATRRSVSTSRRGATSRTTSTSSWAPTSSADRRPLCPAGAEYTPGMSATSGHCLCRAVAFRYEGKPNWTLYCHCESCRRATSSAVATWISVPRNAFRFTAGEPAYYASSPGVRRGFCARCGSPLSYENERLPGEIHLLAGALSDPRVVEPTAHLYVRDQLPWFETADALARYERFRRDGGPLRHGPRR